MSIWKNNNSQKTATKTDLKIISWECGVGNTQAISAQMRP